MKDDAQIHILEVILMSGIMLMALFFISNFEVPTHTTIGKENSLESLGEGILASLDGIPYPGNENDDTYYSSLLARYVHEIKIKYDDLNDPTNCDQLNTIEELQALKNYFETNLPEGTIYQLFLYDVTKMSQEGLSADYTDELYCPSVILIGEKISTSRIIVIDGHIYNLVLVMSFTLK